MTKKIIGAGLLLFVFAACSPKAEKDANAYSGIITFKTGTVMVDSNAAVIGAKVMKDNKISVGDKSSAVIQFGNDANITLKPNTVITVQELVMGKDGKPTVGINQEKGSTFSRVVTKGSDYQIRTQTMVAGVRGTSFQFNVDEKNPSKVEIQLLEGRVEAKKVVDQAASETSETAASETEEVIVLTAGEKVVVESKVAEPVKTKLTTPETTSLEKLNQVAMVAEPEKISEKSEAGSAEEKSAPAVVIPEEVQQEMLKPQAAAAGSAVKGPASVSLEDLRNSYGRIGKITTKSGKTYVGSFSIVGGNMEVITTSGKVVIPNSDVASVTPQ